MSVVPYDFTIVYLKNGIIHELGGEFSPIAPCPKKGDRLSDFVRSRGGKFEQKIKEIEAQTAIIVQAESRQALEHIEDLAVDGV
ncbi:MAG: hypothetical protein ACPGXK_00290, partial [Phycisphaerae bacterium]